MIRPDGVVRFTPQLTSVRIQGSGLTGASCEKVNGIPSSSIVRVAIDCAARSSPHIRTTASPPGRRPEVRKLGTAPYFFIFAI